MISVVIPLYNKEEQIAHTLQSVFTQTFQNFEIVIVDDGSTDNSVEEVEKFTDSRIRLIHQTNAGVSAARNRGIEEARGELIAFLDADDEWMPEYLATQYGLYQKYPECSVYACNYEIRDFEGKVTPTIIRKLPFEGEDGILSNYFEVASCSHVTHLFHFYYGEENGYTGYWGLSFGYQIRRRFIDLGKIGGEWDDCLFKDSTSYI